MDLNIALSILSIVIIPIIAYLLNKKDGAQEKELTDLKAATQLLFKKHDDDVAALQALQLQIAKEHYLKHELDQRFLSLEAAIKESSADLGKRFDHLAGVLLEHVAKGR